MSKVRVKYNGSRFPRIVNKRGGTKTSFQVGRLILELEEYDAMLLLKSNIRLDPSRWEFTIASKEDVKGEKEAAEAKAEAAKAGGGVDLEALNKTELQEMCLDKDIEFKNKDTKQELIDLIKADQEEGEDDGS